jgi:hypothetical protein
MTPPPPQRKKIQLRQPVDAQSGVAAAKVLLTPWLDFWGKFIKNCRLKFRRCTRFIGAIGGSTASTTREADFILKFMLWIIAILTAVSVIIIRRCQNHGSLTLPTLKKICNEWRGLPETG